MITKEEFDALKELVVLTAKMTASNAKALAGMRVYLNHEEATENANRLRTMAKEIEGGDKDTPS